jgi:hypothetical protein
MSIGNYAKIDSNNLIVNVERADENWVAEFESQNPDSEFTYIKETSATKEATIDGTYDPENKVFIKVKPFSDWVLDESFDWIPSVPKPTGNFEWNQQTKEWVEFPVPTKPYPIDGRVYRWDVENDEWVALD